MEKSIVIAGYKRSPFHLANKGALTKVRPDELVAAVIRGLIEETGVNGEDIEEIIVGNAMPEGEQGMNIGRYAVFLAGLPVKTAGTTVN
ncbi:MAG: acetyl-CoA C-acyltransferase, partial [Rhodospirillaceae bacterium]|nr:acetyl-CoA C-acyltransferase [Rhodospirillaceae bacterium]